MAPEQITGTGLDVRADVYAAGVLLYELLADRRPFLSERRSELLRAHLLQAPPPLSEARPELQVDPALEAIVLRCLAKAPEARYRSAQEILDALGSLPDDAARLTRPTSLHTRSREGATSEVITSGERRAVSESISGSQPGQKLTPPAGPTPVLAPPLEDAALAPVAEPPARAVPEGAAIAPASAPDTREPTERFEALSGGERSETGLSTGTLYVVAVALFAVAALLWLWLGPR
jgi:serine/threonine-protein kinase